MLSEFVFPKYLCDSKYSLLGQKLSCFQIFFRFGKRQEIIQLFFIQFFHIFFRFGTREKVQKERNFVFILFSIVLTFFFCHVLSVVVDFFELMHVNQARGAGRQNRQHPLHRLTLRCLTQPLPALSAVYYTTCPSVELPTEQAGRCWVSRLKTTGECCPFSERYTVYSLGQTEPQNKKRVPTTLLISEKKPNPKKLHLGVLILASC